MPPVFARRLPLDCAARMAGSMAVQSGPPATSGCEPRQARKGATVAAKACAGMRLDRIAARPASANPERCPSGRRSTPGKCVCGNASRVRIPPSPRLYIAKWLNPCRDRGRPSVGEDGESIPPPRSIDAIRADLKLAHRRDGTNLMLLPLLLDRGSSRRVNIFMDHGLLEAINDEARQRRMTRLAFLAIAARHEIEAR